MLALGRLDRPSPSSFVSVDNGPVDKSRISHGTLPKPVINPTVFVTQSGLGSLACRPIRSLDGKHQESVRLVRGGQVFGLAQNWMFASCFGKPYVSSATFSSQLLQSKHLICRRYAN